MRSAENFTEHQYTNVSSTNPKIHFTPEEIAVIKQCNREGLYKRGVPCGALFAYGAFYALKSGMIKPHARYGSIPAVALGCFAGLITGSLSYKGVCLKRVLELPNGTLKKQLDALMQQQKPITPASTQFSTENMELDTESSMIPGTEMESYQPTNSFDGFTGIDIDGDRSSQFNTVEPFGKFEGPSQTYDELRRKNREEYMRSISSRKPQESPGARSIRSQTQIPEENQGFDRDRVPQYQLVD